MSRLMSRALMAFGLGGWSDAVYWRAMEARVRVTALGDVRMKLSFVDDVYEPFVRTGGRIQVREAAEDYPLLYKSEEPRPSVAETLEDEFVSAWEAEFGISLQGCRHFLDRLEEIGLQRSELVFYLPRSTLITILAEVSELSIEKAEAALDMFSLRPRPEWRVVGETFEERDWQPWRFRRRLSVLRRPLFQIDELKDPNFLVAPGLADDAVYALVRWFHSGEIPQWQLRSTEMRTWAGRRNHVHRTKFNAEVASRMRELGWLADAEVGITKLLERPLNRNFGDIDVLAWQSDSGRVLAIECKDLQFRKTLGEVAGQLADFRGEVQPNGKPDLLRKHLDRIDVLNANAATIGQKLKLSAPIQLEGHLIFKNPVPMQFAWDHMASKIQLSLFDQLDRL